MASKFRFQKPYLFLLLCRLVWYWPICSVYQGKILSCWTVPRSASVLHPSCCQEGARLCLLLECPLPLQRTTHDGAEGCTPQLPCGESRLPLFHCHTRHKCLATRLTCTQVAGPPAGRKRGPHGRPHSSLFWLYPRHLLQWEPGVRENQMHLFVIVAWRKRRQGRNGNRTFYSFVETGLG